jgi:hypothetical protein
MYVSANLLTAILFLSFFFLLVVVPLCARFIGNDRKRKSTPSKIWDGATVLPLGYSTWVLTHLFTRKEQRTSFPRYNTSPNELSDHLTNSSMGDFICLLGISVCKICGLPITWCDFWSWWWWCCSCRVVLSI